MLYQKEEEEEEHFSGTETAQEIWEWTFLLPSSSSRSAVGAEEEAEVEGRWKKETKLGN